MLADIALLFFFLLTDIIVISSEFAFIYAFVASLIEVVLAFFANAFAVRKV